MIRRTLPLSIAIFVLLAMAVKFLDTIIYPDSHEIVGVEYVAQPDEITCGPTSALMLLRLYGKQPTLNEVQAQTKTKWLEYKGAPIGMTSPEYISVALRHFGVRARMRSTRLDGLKEYVSQNRPCIALLRSSRTTWHYVLVTGYDPSTVIIADPAGGVREEMPVANFLGAWEFKTDMDGVPVTMPCSVCGGSGHLLPPELGPVSICDICSGSGRQPDLIASFLRTADVNPNTLIVPDRAYQP